ncbi:hypothetical protein [Calothrix sp. NIES-2098]|uniref:hypothetical protein n=1 Tax=Calothrix sp. NIES-2098 TaxID=1954171 RepID=UPI000B5EC94C|nr:hypothetical protein NIES2098_35750 [Calothrix sp. NIES-2098]
MKQLLKIQSLLLGFLKPKSRQPKIESYGQTDCNVDPMQIQQIVEWLFASLLNAEYFGQSHLIWDSGQDWVEVAKTGLLKDEPVFLYQCGEKLSVAPEHCYWRLMAEHPCLRIYQLEVEEG